MMQKILVAVAAGVAMVNGAAHVADCFTGVACPPDATGAETVAIATCVSDCSAALVKANKTEDVPLCSAPMVNFTAACVAEAATETGSGEDGAAGADATLPSVLAFTVGAAVAGMM